MKRSAILYIRITPKSKKWVEIQAKRAGVSVSVWMEGFISKSIKKPASKKRPPIREVNF